MRPLTEQQQALLPDESHLGPAMKALTPRMRLFVMACLDLGVKVDYSKAARAAGYKPGKKGGSQLWVQGHRLAHDPRVQAAILEEAKNRLQFATLSAAKLLVEIMGDEKAPLRERMKAAQMIMDRGGLHVLTEHRVDVTHSHQTRQEKIVQIIQLARNVGVDPRVFLGNLEDVVDADYELIEEPKEPVKH